jgi:hypothetical protein
MVIICTEMSECLTDCGQARIVEQRLVTNEALLKAEVCKRWVERTLAGEVPLGRRNFER